MSRHHQSRPAVLAGAALAALLAGCDAEPRAIRYGRDECAECRMTLVDRNYGAEIVTRKGRVHVFDDINCLLAFDRRDAARIGPGAQRVVAAFGQPDTLLPVEQAHFLQHAGLRSPMASGMAAFATAEDLESVRRQLGGGGRILRWAEVPGAL